MASIFDALLDPDETLTDPVKRQATAAALRRQNAMGVVGQLMGLEPTKAAGSMLQEQSQGSLRSALAKQQAQKEAAARASERQQAQANWQAQMERDQARDAEQRRQFGVQESRLGRAQDAETKAQWAHAVDPITGQMRLYNKYTGEWDEGPSAGGAGGPGTSAGDASGLPSSGVVPPGGKPPSESENKSGLLASTQVGALGTIAGADKGIRKPGLFESLVGATGANPELQTLLTGAVAGPERNTVRGAQDAFIDSALTAITGAAYTPHQIAAFRNRFMPNYFDNEQTMQTKMDAAVDFARQAAIAGGRAWTPERDMQFRRVLAQLYSGGLPQGGDQQGGDQQAPASSGRDFENDPKYKAILGGS